MALTAIVLGRDRRLVPEEVARIPRRAAIVAIPVVFYGFYVIAGALARLDGALEPRPGVRLGAARRAALHRCGLRHVAEASEDFWQHVNGVRRRRCSSPGSCRPASSHSLRSGPAGRTYKNYLASVELGTVLPPGTLVHGKLANGLSLENRIRPIFVGRGFGNYDDRKQRDDVRYILTYVAPTSGTKDRHSKTC